MFGIVRRCKELHELKSLYLLQLAKELPDDKCGEKVALLKPLMDNPFTPEIVKSEYTSMKQQNDQVYYDKEETDIKISHSSLEDLFHNLPSASEWI